MEAATDSRSGAVCKYVSRKISKVRFLDSDAIGLEPKACICGTYDDKNNNISVWSCPGPEEMSGETEPQLLSSLPVDGDVTGLEVLSSDSFVVCFSTGDVIVYNLDCHQDQSIRRTQVWSHAHGYGNGLSARAAGLAVWSAEQIASVGEDGQLVLYNATARRPKVIAADSCALHCACFVASDVVAVTGSSGRVQIWDVRASDSHPQTTFCHSGNGPVAGLCIASHPTQRHVLVVGDEQGAISGWDVRAAGEPMVKEAHAAQVWELRLHPDNSDHMFSCSESGELWHWDGSQAQMSGGAERTWLLHEAPGLQVTQLAPSAGLAINSLDVSGSTLVCGTDAEELQLYTGLRMR